MLITSYLFFIPVLSRVVSVIGRQKLGLGATCDAWAAVFFGIKKVIRKRCIFDIFSRLWCVLTGAQTLVCILNFLSILTSVLFGKSLTFEASLSLKCFLVQTIFWLIATTKRGERYLILIFYLILCLLRGLAIQRNFAIFIDGLLLAYHELILVIQNLSLQVVRLKRLTWLMLCSICHNKLLLIFSGLWLNCLKFWYHSGSLFISL